MPLTSEQLAMLSNKGMLTPAQQSALNGTMGIADPGQQVAPAVGGAPATIAGAGPADPVPPPPPPSPSAPMPSDAAMRAGAGLAPVGAPPPAPAVAGMAPSLPPAAPPPPPAVARAPMPTGASDPNTPAAPPMAAPGEMTPGVANHAPMTMPHQPTVATNPLNAMSGVAADPRFQQSKNDERFESLQATQQGQAVAHEMNSDEAVAGVLEDNQKAQDAIESVRQSQGEHAYAEAKHHYEEAVRAQEKLEHMHVQEDGWSNKTTGQKVGAIFLAIGSALIPGMGVVTGMLNQAAEKDVANQKRLYEETKATGENHMSLYKSAFELTGNSDQAANMAHDALLGKQEAKLGALAARYKGTLAGDKYNAAYLQVQKDRSDLNAQLAMSIKNERAHAAASAASAQEAAAQRAFENRLKKGAADLEGRKQTETERSNKEGEGIKRLEAGGKGGENATKTAIEDEALARDDKSFEDNWKAASENVPGQLHSALNTSTLGLLDKAEGVVAPHGSMNLQDQASAYNQGIGALGKVLTVPGMTSDKDYDLKIRPQLPMPGDSPKRLAEKHAALRTLFEDAHQAATHRKNIAAVAKQQEAAQVASNLGVGKAQ